MLPALLFPGVLGSREDEVLPSSTPAAKHSSSQLRALLLQLLPSAPALSSPLATPLLLATTAATWSPPPPPPACFSSSSSCLFTWVHTLSENEFHAAAGVCFKATVLGSPSRVKPETIGLRGRGDRELPAPPPLEARGLPFRDERVGEQLFWGKGLTALIFLVCFTLTRLLEPGRGVVGVAGVNEEVARGV